MKLNHDSVIWVAHVTNIVIAWLDVYLEVHRLHHLRVPV
jgi:hypothetical protein